jgi:hypothetical protein
MRRKIIINKMTDWRIPGDPRRGMVPHYIIREKIDEEHPSMVFKYTYPHNFLTVSQAFLRKFNLEPRILLTTFTGVE